MSKVSSEGLHPKQGARFVFTRKDGAAPLYQVQVFIADARTLETTLAWGEDGRAYCEPPLADTRAQQETLKLARVLGRTPKERLSRWRDL